MSSAACARCSKACWIRGSICDRELLLPWLELGLELCELELDELWLELCCWLLACCCCCAICSICFFSSSASRRSISCSQRWRNASSGCCLRLASSCCRLARSASFCMASSICFCFWSEAD